MTTYFVRRKNRFLQERVVLSFDMASTAATETLKFHYCAHPFRVERADIVNPTGLVADASNYFVITLQDGATVMATWSTLTGANGSLPANTFTQLVNSAVSGALDAAAGDTLSMVLTLHGTQTLPAGRLVLHGRYL